MTNVRLWADIPGYEGYYQINIIGEIRSLSKLRTAGKKRLFYPMRLLKPTPTKNGYSIVSIWKDGQMKRCHIHRLLAETFIPNPHNKDQVNHINGVKSDNRIENLEWVTQSENTIHAFKTGLMPSKRRKRTIACE